MSARPWRIEIANPEGDYSYVTSFASEQRGLNALNDYSRLWPDERYRLVNYAERYCETDPRAKAAS